MYLVPEGYYRNYLSIMLTEKKALSGYAFGASDLTEEEVNAHIIKFNTAWSFMLVKSQGIKGFLEALLEGNAGMDMFDNLNERFRGLNNEAETLKNRWAAIFNTEKRNPAREEAALYESEADRIVAMFNKMYDMYQAIAADPKKYSAMYEQPSLWQNFVGMFLTDVPAAAGAGVGSAIKEFGKTMWPVLLVGVGVIALWKLPEIVRAVKGKQTVAA